MGARTYVQLAIGARIGGYEVRSLLARGETAMVYECAHLTLGRAVAIKLLHAHLARDEEVAARFVREGRALSLVNHPNVVEVLDLGEREGTPYLVTALVEGEDLHQHLARQQPMSGVEAVDCVLPVVAGVVAAHDAGIVYRDVKPTNIRMALDHRGALVPRVLDFGISKITGDEEGAKLAALNQLLATASYMSPEQLRSTKLATVRSDVYSLGVILYEAATGRRPFQGRNAVELMSSILASSADPPSRVRPEMPAALDNLIQRAMCRHPADRFVSARELGRALAPLGSDPDAWLGQFAPRSGHRIVTKVTKLDGRKRKSH